MTKAQDQTADDIPYDPPPIWIRGRSIITQRETIQRKPADQEWLDTLCPDERMCVDAWLKEVNQAGAVLAPCCRCGVRTANRNGHRQPICSACHVDLEFE